MHTIDDSDDAEPASDWESELEAADDYANELRTEASVALDKFISLVTFTPAYAKNMIDDLCLFMGSVADIQSCKYPLHPLLGLPTQDVTN